MTTMNLYEGLSTVEAGRRLGISTEEVYRRLFAGEIDGGPDRKGIVRIPEAEVERLVAGKLPAS